MESIVGGVIIGLAVSAMLLFNGRITGISGIVGAILNRNTLDKNWRVMFLAGLFAGGVILRFTYPSSFQVLTNASSYDYMLGGFLVGFGTLLGNGCTSGHGVCGISRLSLRSVLSTITFILFGVLSVWITNSIRGGV